MHPNVNCTAQACEKWALAGYRDQQNNMTSAKRACNSGLASLGLVLCAALLAPGAVVAQTISGGAQAGVGVLPPDLGGAQQTSGAAGVRLDPFVLYPSVSLVEGYNDNLTLSNNNQVKSAVTILSPALLAELKGDSSTYRLSYIGTWGTYASSSADNYLYNELHGSAEFEFSGRSRLRLLGDYLLKSDPRGSTLASTGLTTPNKYHLADVGGIYSYGAAGAQGRIELQGLVTNKEYTNNRFITTTLDFNSYQGGGTFFWRVGPKTEWLFQAQETRTDYISGLSVQDNTERRALTGLKWEATALTTGTFKVGESWKKYDNSSQANPKGFIWEGSVIWSPLTYSIVTLTTGKNYLDSQAGLGSSYVTDSYYYAVWNHAWTERVRTVATGSYVTDKYQGFAREDKTSLLGAKVTYDMRRWLTLGAEYTYSQRNSSAIGADYRRNLILFSLKATL